MSNLPLDFRDALFAGSRHTPRTARRLAFGGHYMSAGISPASQKPPSAGQRQRYSVLSWWFDVKSCRRIKRAAIRAPTVAPHAIMYITTI